MYRRPKFLETLLEIREQMALEADYDVDLYVEMVRSGRKRKPSKNVTAEEPKPKTRRRVPTR